MDVRNLSRIVSQKAHFKNNRAVYSLVVSENLSVVLCGLLCIVRD